MLNLARVKRGMYFDSISLMLLAGTLREREGIAEAAAVMGTPANLQLLAETGLAPFTGPAQEPESNDLLIVVRADDEALALAALEAGEALLLRDMRTRTAEIWGDGEGRAVQAPRSLEEARSVSTQANIAVISVPGMYAALEAQQALLAGLHVFLFSDNVSLEDEVALKGLGAQRGLLVMGPDCGTARLNGIALGFANVVPDGPVGIVGASGTGMQQVMCLLSEAGRGISQAIGCGGRDLSAEVGGATTLQGLRLLQEDEQTRVIVLISKPPAPQVAEKVLTAAASGGKPVVVNFVGTNTLAWQQRYAGKIAFVRTLAEAARMADALCATSESIGQMPHLHEKSDPLLEVSGVPQNRHQPPHLAALFSGGTLCEEALHIWGERPGPVYSNVPLNPAWLWRAEQTPAGHYALDLGDDEYTRGRPHPMIDPEARLKYLRTAASNPLIGVILLDLVLGYCAHADPAAIYAQFIQESIQQTSRTGRCLHYVISLCGTEDDPQRLSWQAARLREAGAEVYTSNAEAAARCLALLEASLK